MSLNWRQKEQTVVCPHYYREEVPIHMTTWMDLENMRPSEEATHKS